MLKNTLPLDDIRAYCKSQPIRKLSLFGSVLRDGFDTESDVDILVEFKPEAEITYYDLFDIQTALADIVGRKVDLATPAALSPFNQAVTVYSE